MRRIALLSLMTMLGGCGYNTWSAPPFSTGTNPNLPITNSVNMSRVMGYGVAVTPLTTEPGDIWPGPLPPPRTLRDLERPTPMGSQSAAPVRGSPLDRAGNPLLAPLPYGIPGDPPRGAPTDARRGSYPVPTPAAPSQPQTDRRIIVPNGNGTSTVIHPDGRIETIPTPK
ncbi:MAG: hypothetical protein EXR07_18875 [Acetobacteraceae bacterium]|nr:hypothetical protein [Acetobacteraceae bacterium]